jgi:hemin uptake protein HemP
MIVILNYNRGIVLDESLDMRQLNMTSTNNTSSAKSTTTTIPATALFQGTSVVVIEYKGEQYHLSITRNDKLILTK